jgi:NDP-sugar pyrophosphorylase family protein
VALQCAEQLMAQYQKTQSHLLAKSTPGGPTIVGNVMIHPSARIHPKSKLGPNVSIGKNVVIGSGVRVKQAIILDNVEIKEHACVLGSIIGWGSTIGQWARVEGEPTTAGAGVQDVRDCGLTLFGLYTSLFSIVPLLLFSLSVSPSLSPLLGSSSSFSLVFLLCHCFLFFFTFRQ